MVKQKRREPSGVTISRRRGVNYTMNKVLKVAWFATKVGIGGGVIYVTVDQGIWGDSHRAAATYDRLYDIMPGTKSVSEKYLQLPKKDDVNINFRSYWNTGIFYTFDFIANLPSKIVRLKDVIIDFATSPPVPDKQNEQQLKAEETNMEESQLPPSTPVDDVTATPPQDSVDSPPPLVPHQADEKSD
ncbi:uncharacterized protein LOC121853717 [Homarus americanus]|uniref:MICOS complex subunit MIC13 n=1 Tax=Homarus americanus TaxID=6706 RepID=A0A8J5MM41_HOMAM|nr:uncharacterized protein LOC121853717 [Homarus americanus]KAG7156471.1 MICOS complex subunit MIC13 QIL1-like [Homarus americanus]